MTKKEAQLALANLKRYMSGGGAVDRGTNKAIDMAIEALSQPEQHWIPVEKERPKEDGEYIVTIQCEHVDGWDDYVAGFAEWNGDDWHLVSYYPGQIKAVAWCELPEIYKGVTK